LRISQIISIAAVFLVLSACDHSTGPSGTGAPEKLSDVEFWMYQIQGQNLDGAIEALGATHYDMLVIDQTRSIAGEENWDSAGDVAYLQSTGKMVICYIDVGEAEDYRWYWQSNWEVGNPQWISGEDPDGWDGNYPVLFWYTEWKTIMAEYLTGIVNDGYDGIYLDWLEAYDFDAVVSAAQAQGLDPEDLLIEYVQWIEEYVHNLDPDFIIIAQNAAEMGYRQSYLQVFDGIAQEAIWYDGGGDPDTGEIPGDVTVDPSFTAEYIQSLQYWKTAGLPVFNCEYCQESDHTSTAYGNGEQHGYNTLCTLRPLNQVTETPPPGY